MKRACCYQGNTSSVLSSTFPESLLTTPVSVPMNVQMASCEESEEASGPPSHSQRFQGGAFRWAATALPLVRLAVLRAAGAPSMALSSGTHSRHLLRRIPGREFLVHDGKPSHRSGRKVEE